MTCCKLPAAFETKKKIPIAAIIYPALFVAKQEENLFSAIEQVELQVNHLMETGNFSAALATLAALRQPIDAFFEHVLVNDEREDIRANRLGLLARIRIVTGRVADFSKLVT